MTETTRTRRTAPKATPDAAADKDASVLNGVGTDKPAPKTPARTRRTPAAKASPKPASKAAPKASPKPAAAKPAPKSTANGKASANGSEPGYRRYATSEIPAAMMGFTKWIAREFPELGPIDPRLVTIASKGYRYFQASDLNR
jgi:hypothetical protein